MSAEDNWKFLLCLEQPCQQLHKALPSQIPDLLPHILSCVRMIWNVSRFYNTPERITVLLRKLSNEIILRCCSIISLNEMFTGDVPSVIDALSQCMKAAGKWKKLYTVTAAAVKAHSAKPWNFDTSSIFAQVDAFIQRCRDLQEVCDAQLQFSNRAVVPRFSGARAADIEKNFADIQASFGTVLGELQRKSRKYNMLDVKGTRWFDDFNIFMNSMRDLEVMLMNLLQMALDSSSNLVARLELLEAFQIMAKVGAVKRFVERSTSEWFGLYLGEINTVKKLFDSLKRTPVKSPELPRYAGLAKGAQNLMKRLEQSANVLVKVKHMLPVVAEAEETIVAAELSHNALAQFIFNTHNEWFNTVPANLKTWLQANLLSQSRSAGGLLSVNFHPELLAMSQEVHYWERMRMNIPYVAMEVQAQREKYRVLRDNMLTIVRDYNKVGAAAAAPPPPGAKGTDVCGSRDAARGQNVPGSLLLFVRCLPWPAGFFAGT